MNRVKRVVAIIPARGGSVGVPRKNIKQLAGKPLVGWTIEAALQSRFIDDVIVNTEDREIWDYADSLGVGLQSRPDEFLHDNTFMEVDRLLCWSLQDLASKGRVYDIIVLLYPTSPLRSVESIDSCIELVSSGMFDSSLTITESRQYIWKKIEDREEVVPVNYDPEHRGPNQLEGWNQYIENKAVYATKTELLMKHRCRLMGSIGMVEMPKLRSVDIDTADDFSLAEALISTVLKPMDR